MRTKLLLLLGPSGVGKSSVIGQLKMLDKRFVYINPLTTRPLRPGETDKVSVSDDALNRLWRAGAFVAVNELYGVRYGTPREPIIQAFRAAQFPVLDWPVRQVSQMEAAFPGDLLTVYIEPPSLPDLRNRLGSRGETGGRWAEAVSEAHDLRDGKFDQSIGLRIINAEGEVLQTALAIFAYYAQSIGIEG